MFALWYLSLAVDELRKRYGWTFFDIFYKSNQTETKALDNKPANETKIVEPSQPGIAKIAPKVAPVPTVQPVQAPASTPTPVKKPDMPPAPASISAPPTASTPIPTPLPVKKPDVPPASGPKAEPLTLITSVNKPEIPSIPKKAPVAEPSKPFAAPLAKPEVVPITPPSPKKSFERNTNNSLDKKFMEVSKAKTNGENLKNNLKSATMDFLSGETNGHASFKSKLDTMVDAAVLAKLEDGFAKLAASDSKSLLKKYLTKQVFDNLKNKKTPSFGSTLLDCIQSGLENHDSGVGIYAPDAEAYTVFAELFDPIIEDYHGGFKKTDKHPARDFGDVSVFANLDPNNEFVISTRVRCGRSMQGYPFNPCLTEAQYKEMEQKVSTTLSGLEGELKGKFYPLTGMEKAVQQQLIDDHFLFKEGDRFLQAANACRYWPSGRGIYHNDNKTFLVWCNEEDHLRIISMQMGGDLGEVYRRLVTAVNDIEKRIPFSHDDRLGFLTFCPTNLGTTIRASVHIKVPKLASNMAKLEEIAGKYNLQVRGTRGEHTEAEGGIYDISNKRRMGLTEFQAVKEMYDGIAELIKIEKSM